MSRLSDSEIPPHTKKHAPRRFVVSYIFLAIAFCILGVELGVRLLGYRPRQVDDRINISVEPGGRFFELHDQLGYTHIPGSFHVTLPTGYTFDVNHDSDSYRITRPLDDYLEEIPRDELWIFGGSFTHGWSVDDNETFPWLLQRKMPDLDIRNYGVSGYGTVQAFVQLDSLLSEGRRPALVVAAYSSYHDERNTFARTRREALTRWNHLGPLRQPVAEVHRDSIRIRLAEMSYIRFPLSDRLAASFAMELAYNRFDLAASRSSEVTRRLFQLMARRCSDMGVPFLVAGLLDDDKTMSMISSLEASSIPTANISVDLDKAGFRNVPHDRHPSAVAHAEYADRLFEHVASVFPTIIE